MEFAFASRIETVTPLQVLVVMSQTQIIRVASKGSGANDCQSSRDPAARPRLADWLVEALPKAQQVQKKYATLHFVIAAADMQPAVRQNDFPHHRHSVWMVLKTVDQVLNRARHHFHVIINQQRVWSRHAFKGVGPPARAAEVFVE